AHWSARETGKDDHAARVVDGRPRGGRQVRASRRARVGIRAAEGEERRGVAAGAGDPRQYLAAAAVQDGVSDDVAIGCERPAGRRRGALRLEARIAHAAAASEGLAGVPEGLQGGGGGERG